MKLDRNCPGVGGAYIVEHPDDFKNMTITDVHEMRNQAKALRVGIENGLYERPRIRMVVYCHRDLLRVALETGVTKKRY